MHEKTNLCVLMVQRYEQCASPANFFSEPPRFFSKILCRSDFYDYLCSLKMKMTMTINEIQDEIIEEFSGFDDWMDKYQLLIDLGNEQEPLEDQYKTEQNLIDGCQSRVWLVADYVEESGDRSQESGVIRFRAESDALIVKGIVSLLIRVLSGHTPQEILDADLYFIDKIGLKEHLSPTRSNGLLAMVKQMRMYALAFNSTK